MKALRRHAVPLAILAILSSILPALIIWIALDNHDPDYIGMGMTPDGRKFEYYRVREILTLFAAPFALCFVPLAMIYSVILVLGRR